MTSQEGPRSDHDPLGSNVPHHACAIFENYRLFYGEISSNGATHDDGTGLDGRGYECAGFDDHVAIDGDLTLDEPLDFQVYGAGNPPADPTGASDDADICHRVLLKRPSRRCP
jgi:hypothetical protein